MRPAWRAVVIALVAASAACRPDARDANKMHTSDIETILSIPWGNDRAQLALSVVPYPALAESSDAGQSPEFPAMRVMADGAVVVVNYFDNRYLPAGALTWFVRKPGTTDVLVRSVAHPFADHDRVRAMDFVVLPDDRLILLETVDSEAGARSRLAVMAADGTVQASNDALDGGPHVRVVPDDRGRLFVLAHKNGNQLMELDPATASVQGEHTAVPGTRLAVAANKGARISASLLEHADDARIRTATTAPAALTYLFGIDDKGDYYAHVDEQIMVISFAGEVRRKLALTGLVGTMDRESATLVSRLSPMVSWQVDASGRIYLPRVTAQGFSVLRTAAD